MVIWRVLVVVETQIIHYNLYETSAVDPRAAYDYQAWLENSFLMYVYVIGK